LVNYYAGGSCYGSTMGMQSVILENIPSLN